MVTVPFMSKRFAMKRFLGLTQEEIAENETQWKEENIDEDIELSANAELRGAGITTGSIGDDLSSIGANTAAPADMGGDMAGTDQAMPTTPEAPPA
jgi:hypothetical protein